jgi:hypothetical protein
MDIKDIYRVFYPAEAQYTFFSVTHGTFSKIDILGQKTSLKKYIKFKITLCIVSYHNRIKLDLSNKRNSRKYSNSWRLNNTFYMTNESLKGKEEFKKFLKSIENKNTTYQNLWEIASQC